MNLSQQYLIELISKFQNPFFNYDLNDHLIVLQRINILLL